MLAMDILVFLIALLAYIVLIGIINERFFHLQSDIALIFFTLLFSMIAMGIQLLLPNHLVEEYITRLSDFHFREYLINGMLCFMLFAGASKVNIRKLRTNVRSITLLTFLTTFLSALFFGVMFYIVALTFTLPIGFWTCVLLGCIVSPTDPIAATGILSKIGLSKNVCSVIENESLFNDGMGVTLFIFVKSIVIQSNETTFTGLMFREVCGAVAVALTVSFLLFKLIKLTRDPIRYILISLLDVSSVYVICEIFGFSGVIASVVCGIYFSAMMDRIRHTVAVVDRKDFYRDFWEIMENILNSVLFVMIGFTVMSVRASDYYYIILPATIIALLLSRFAGVYFSTVLIGNHIPGSYDRFEFVSLMTWSALKGGLSLALALETFEFLPTNVYTIILNTTYIAIFFSVLVQGLTIKRVYFALERRKARRIREQ